MKLKIINAVRLQTYGLEVDNKKLENFVRERFAFVEVAGRAIPVANLSLFFPVAVGVGLGAISR